MPDGSVPERAGPQGALVYAEPNRTYLASLNRFRRPRPELLPATGWILELRAPSHGQHELRQFMAWALGALVGTGTD